MGESRKNPTPAMDRAKERSETAPARMAAAVTTPGKRRRWRRGRIAQVTLSAFVLLAGVAAGEMSGWNVAKIARASVAPITTPAETATSDSHPTSPENALSRRVTMPTATPKPAAPPKPAPPKPAQPKLTPKKSTAPKLAGDGTSGAGVSGPAYTAPVTTTQVCPSGQAAKPASWAIGSAGAYGAPVRNTVALTFDDGPSPSSTPEILATLKRTHTPATFFVIGQSAKAYPWLVRREAAEGFTVGVHTWNHPDMRRLTPAQRAWQIAATIKQIHADAGQDTCVWLWRPPYGAYNSSIIRQARADGLTTIMWNVDPVDWSRPGTMAIVNRVLAQARPGSIILMHDGPAGREQTVAALPYIIKGLRARGLTPVSLSQLMQGYQPPSHSQTASQR
jgi:peptidoglycan/xylan/chitin deacetylase (PgdA/CDA1 family)